MKIKLRNILLIALALCLCVSLLGACGGDDADEPQTTDDIGGGKAPDVSDDGPKSTPEVQPTMLGETADAVAANRHVGDANSFHGGYALFDSIFYPQKTQNTAKKSRR